MAAKNEVNVSSITIAKHLGNPRDVLDLPNGEKMILGIVGGVCVAVEDKLTRNGEISKICAGDFRAFSKDGQVYRSGYCWLPGWIHNRFTAELVKMVGDDNVQAVEFGFEIAAIKDKEASVAFRYEFRDLMPPSPTDPLIGLMSKLEATNALAFMKGPQVAAIEDKSAEAADAAKEPQPAPVDNRKKR